MGRLTEAFDYLNSEKPDLSQYYSLGITEDLKAARKEYRKWLKQETQAQQDVPWNTNSINCDGGHSSESGVMDFNIKDTLTGELILDRKYPAGTNNIAEFLGVVFSMIYLEDNDLKDKVIYTDSVTALTWVRNKKMNSSFNYSHHQKLNADITLALEFLRHADLKEFKIEKWQTKEWGIEILSDYNRK